MAVKVKKVVRQIGGKKSYFIIVTFLFLTVVSYSWLEINFYKSTFARNVDFIKKISVFEKFQERMPFSWLTSYKNKPAQRHIVFLKVHKAASTTMQNILLRHALQNKLNVLFPKRGPHLNEVGSKIFKNAIVEHPPNKKFDILCNHVVFNFSEINPYFPPSTRYVGIVREPFDQFRSAFKFYSLGSRRKYLREIADVNPKNPMQEHLKDPFRFEPYDPRVSHTNNRMSVDFGFPLDNFERSKKDAKKIKSFLTYLDTIFDLVLVEDMFDESMILFRRVMNWDMKDVLYLKLNKFSSYLPWNTSYTEEDYLRFQKWATLDYALYNHFLKIFKTKIGSEPRFQDEVNAFRKIRSKVTDYCEQVKDVKNISSLLIEGNEWTHEFRVSPLLCRLMGKRELPMVVDVRKAQQNRMKEL